MNEDVTAKLTSSKSLRIRSLWLVFVVCFIVFISIILNVAHRSLSSEYTKMCCKDTNFLSFKHQNNQKIIQYSDNLTIIHTIPHCFGCKTKERLCKARAEAKVTWIMPSRSQRCIYMNAAKLHPILRTAQYGL